MAGAHFYKNPNNPVTVFDASYGGIVGISTDYANVRFKIEDSKTYILRLVNSNTGATVDESNQNGIGWKEYPFYYLSKYTQYYAYLIEPGKADPWDNIGFTTWGADSTVTPSANNISSTSATININHIIHGATYQSTQNKMQVSDHGWFWLQGNSKPGFSNTKISQGSFTYNNKPSTTPSSVNLTGLSPNTTYSICAYVKLSDGDTILTNHCTFTTTSPSSPPTYNPPPVEVTPPAPPATDLPIRVTIDTPVNGQKVTAGSTINIGGWALDAPDPISYLDIFIDGVSIGYAAYGASRPDVYSVFPEYNNSYSGWNKGWSIPSNISSGDHNIVAVAYNTTGGTGFASVIVNIDNPPTAPVLDATGGIRSISVSWNSISGASSYELQRSIGNSSAFVAYQTLYGTSFIDNNVNVGTTYYYKVRCKNSGGQYSNWSNIDSAIPYDLLKPEVLTIRVQDASISAHGANVDGEVLSGLNYGHSSISSRGMCYSTINSMPTIFDLCSTVSGGIGTFTSTLQNLQRDTLYYVRAFATNDVGTGYGVVLTFRTLPEAPEIDINIANENLYPKKFTTDAEITDNGGRSIIETGFYISTVPNPAITGTKVNVSFVGSLFSKLFDPLIASTTYYVVAYAINSYPLTGYSDVLVITTPDCPPMPTPSLPEAIDITDVSMTWVNHTRDAKIIVEGFTGENTSPYALINLTPDTIYRARSYVPGDLVWNENSEFTAWVSARTLHSTPVKPEAIEIDTTSMVWICATPGAVIVCNGETKSSGSKWTGMTPNTEYEAWAYVPATSGWSNQSKDSEHSLARTLKIKYGTPTKPVIEKLSSRTAKITSLPTDPVGRVVILCNGEIKESGSIWKWLTPSTTYTAVAFVPADEDHRRSNDSEPTDFTTLTVSNIEPDLTLIGFMDDGSRAPIQLLETVNISTDKEELLDIKGKKILVIENEEQKATLTYKIEDVTTKTELTIGGNNQG